MTSLIQIKAVNKSWAGTITILHNPPARENCYHWLKSLLILTEVLITICLVLSGSNRTTNIMMYLHFSHSIEHRFASVESKRRQDFYHLLLPVMLAFHNQSLLKSKTHPTSCPTIFKNRDLSFRLNTVFLTTITITSCYVLRCSPWLNFPYGRSLPPLQRPPEGGP